MLYRIIMNLKTFPLCLACLCSVIFTLASITSADNVSQLPYQLKKEIANHQDDANKIIDFLTKGPGKHQVYNRLATFVDTYGSRFAGSANLEHAIDYMLHELNKDKLDNVHGEEVLVPHWVRGEESAQMMLPRNQSVALLGLGSSVGTPPNGITAEVLLVRSFDELRANAAKAKGKIVVFNDRWVDYRTSVIYRERGAAEVAKVGGVASLIRSVTPFSIYSPHTGWQLYEQGVKKIPTACITVEDAEMMTRMAARGTKIVINLKMAAKNLPPAVSRNTVAEIKGSVYPEQVVLVGGHLDSWDVGQGAMDDGGGAFISWQAMSVIRQLDLRPKRTMRMVLWTAEEEGLVGAEQYYNRHKGSAANFSLVMESDTGTFMPTGISFTGSEKGAAIMREVMSLLKPINVTNFRVKNVGGQISFWVRDGVPGGVLDNENSEYFFFQHTNGDAMTVQDPDAMDLCAAVWAVVAYTVADLDELLPRD